MADAHRLALGRATPCRRSGCPAPPGGAGLIGALSGASDAGALPAVVGHGATVRAAPDARTDCVRANSQFSKSKQNQRQGWPMSDYLTNLAARALGVAEVARPRPSLFEPRRGVAEPPIPAEPARGEVEPEVRAPDVAAEAPPRRQPAEPAAVREREGTSAPDGDRGPPRVAAPQRAPGRGRRRPETAPPRPAEPGAAPSAARERRAPAAPFEPAAPRLGVPTQPARPAELQRPVAAPVLAARPPRPQVAAGDAPAPTVRVTIGRVDVRAVTPEQPPEQKRKPKRAPRMSLDEYLSRPGRPAG